MSDLGLYLLSIIFLHFGRTGRQAEFKIHIVPMYKSHGQSLEKTCRYANQRLDNLELQVSSHFSQTLRWHHALVWVMTRLSFGNSPFIRTGVWRIQNVPRELGSRSVVVSSNFFIAIVFVHEQRHDKGFHKE